LYKGLNERLTEVNQEDSIEMMFANYKFREVNIIAVALGTNIDPSIQVCCKLDSERNRRDIVADFQVTCNFLIILKRAC